MIRPRRPARRRSEDDRLNRALRDIMLLAIIAEFRLYGRQLADEYLHTLGEECYGSIYSNLKRLRAGGHIAPAKLTPAEQKRIPRSAKVYELTPKGQKLLRTMQQMFETRIAGAGSRAA